MSGSGRKRKHHDSNCRKLAYLERQKAQAAEALYATEIAAARRHLEISGEEALDLLLDPSERARAALAVRELVARTLAAFDSGRLDIARRAAGPIARDIFVELEAMRGR